MLPSLHALPTSVPSYFGLDDGPSSALENWLSDRDRRNLQSTNKASRAETAIVELADWRRNENGDPRGPGDWDVHTWEMSLTRGRDDTGTRVQFVAKLEDDNLAIRGNEDGVVLYIPFSETDLGEQVYFARDDDEEFPFAMSAAEINIPEWGLSGRYNLSYDDQKILDISELVPGPSGGRFFWVRILQPVENTTPTVFASFGFVCQMRDNNTAFWKLLDVTFYKE